MSVSMSMPANVTICGLGVIGGSLAYALHHMGVQVQGVDPDNNARTVFYERGIIAQHYTSAHDVLTIDGVLLLCTPPHLLEDTLKALAPNIQPGTLIMDVASTKRFAMESLQPHVPLHAHYVPAHPIAGSAGSGATAAVHGLFEQARVVLCASEQDIANRHISPAMQQALHFWRAIGASPEIMDAAMHDTIYAYVSHLPQIMAYVSYATIREHYAVIPEKLHTFLRIAHSPAALWASILITNSEPVAQALEEVLVLISHIRMELNGGQGAGYTSAIDANANKHMLEVVYPRLVASLLISAVQLLDKRYDIQSLPYQGSGLRDMLSVMPAQTAATDDQDIAFIAEHYASLQPLLERSEQYIRELLIAMRTENWQQCMQALEQGVWK